MKNFNQLLLGLLPLLAFIILSCEGPEGPAGPAGPTGPTGATGSVGPQGPAGIGSFKILNFETTEQGWIEDGVEGEEGYGFIYLQSLPEITESVASTGAVLAFAQLQEIDGWSIWSPLPFSFNTGINNVVSHVSFLYSPYDNTEPENFYLYTYDSNNLYPFWAGAEIKVRVVILYGNSNSRINTETLKRMSWEELESFLYSIN